MKHVEHAVSQKNWPWHYLSYLEDGHQILIIFGTNIPDPDTTGHQITIYR